jgi:hypothetical protein
LSRTTKPVCGCGKLPHPTICRGERGDPDQFTRKPLHYEKVAQMVAIAAKAGLARIRYISDPARPQAPAWFAGKGDTPSTA